MRRPITAVAAFTILLAGGAALQRTVAQDAASTTKRYLPEYTGTVDLLLPKNFEKWVFVGSPLFPEFHNVYMEPGSYEIYQATGQFPEGTIFLKELQLMLPQENPDGSRLFMTKRVPDASDAERLKTTSARTANASKLAPFNAAARTGQSFFIVARTVCRAWCSPDSYEIDNRVL